MRMHLLISVSALAALLLQLPVSGTAGQVTPPFAEFIAIQPGEFRMGCNAYPAVQTVPADGECYDPYKTSGWQDSSPEHSVRITRPFEIGKYEVTQQQWESVMGSNPSHFLDPNNPVESITWFDVQAFLQKLNASSGPYTYRLPTEAEWEYVARAGSSNGTAATGSFETLKSDAHGHTTIPIGIIQVFDPPQGDLDELAWYSGNSGGSTHPVGKKKANAWGLHDVLGNVQEYVQDAYKPTLYTPDPEVDPINQIGIGNLNSRVVRGGSWMWGAQLSRVWARHLTQFADNSNSFTGLRLVRVRKQAVSAPNP